MNNDGYKSKTGQQKFIPTNCPVPTKLGARRARVLRAESKMSFSGHGLALALAAPVHNSIKGLRNRSVLCKFWTRSYETQMLPEIELDVLQFLDRSALEGLQMHSRYLRDLVLRHAPTLPLRYIASVDVSVYLLA